MRVAGLERDYILRLNNADISTASDVVNTGYDILLTLIPESIAGKLYDRCRKISADITQPLSNEAGQPVKTPIRAKRYGNGYELEINDSKIQLQGRLYAYFMRLYNAPSPDGWVDKNMLDSGVNQVKYIYKLRKALEGVEGVKIESDGGGRYRVRLTRLSRKPAIIKN